ncbi:type VI secretion system contractile sheath small subunit [Enterobacter asburiae]|uniref:type VI secretion system contractile sheath small subunit n=1 Tax=Enterobacter asburiae TaxID=61645 RepID=UPI003F572BB2
MSSYQSEIPKARINLQLDLHTGGAQKKSELPLKMVVSGDFSNGRETAPLSERNKVNINKLNMQQVLAEFAPSTSFDVKHTDGDEETEEKINLTFRHMKDFSPEHVARQVPRLQAMLMMRNLLKDLRANLLDDAGFRRELLEILRNPALSDELRAEIAALAPQDI